MRSTSGGATIEGHMERMMIAADHEQTSADLTSELKVLGGAYLRLLLLEIAEANENFEESTGGA
eukprot:2331146-Heterocapsa_arctica.AAC.1